MPGRLQDKIALVTGAGSGLGAAIAAAFDAEGAKVAVVDVSGSEAEVAEGLPGAIAVHADVSSEDDVSAAFESTVDAFGGLDILVNNAGIEGDMVPLGETSVESFDRVIAVNLRGVFLGIRRAVPLLLDRGGGAVISTASIAGHVGFPGAGPYCASKAGVIGITRAAALEYGGSGIRFNAIAPGVIRTPMTEGQPQEMMDAVHAMTAMGRHGEASEIADAAVFLASDESSFVSGTTLTVDGGYTAA
jgi:NAD(P)-dependent dehydrogenase (short-subunit alcohol dehydrogenase family)